MCPTHLYLAYCLCAGTTADCHNYKHAQLYTITTIHNQNNTQSQQYTITILHNHNYTQPLKGTNVTKAVTVTASQSVQRKIQNDYNWLNVGWLVGFFFFWLGGCQTGWFVGWLVDWVAGLLAGLLTGWFCVFWLIGQLVDWLAVSLFGSG